MEWRDGMRDKMDRSMERPHADGPAQDKRDGRPGGMRDGDGRQHGDGRQRAPNQHDGDGATAAWEDDGGPGLTPAPSTSTSSTSF